MTKLCCPNCNVDFKTEKKLYEHLKSAHSIIDIEKFYVDNFHCGIKPKCECNVECKKYIKWQGWKKGYTTKYVRGHNARIYTAFNDKKIIKENTNKRIEGYNSGKYTVWNKGLSKENNNTVAIISKKITGINRKNWRVDNPEKAAIHDDNVSKTIKSKYDSGELVSWNKGLSKDNNELLSQIAKKISIAQLNNNSNRLQVEEVNSRIINNIEDKFHLLSNIETEYKSRKYSRVTLQCKCCNTIQYKSLYMIETAPVCYNCYPKESFAQLEIYEFVKSICSDAILSDKNILETKELDIWIPSKNFGIEYDGLYFHSEVCLSKDKTINKINEIENSKIKFLRIFEDEWKNKKEIVKSIIRYKLGNTTYKIPARKCKIIELDYKTKHLFFENNHIDGDVQSNIAFGLLYNDIVVAAISLRKPFHKKYKSSIEIARFCTVINASIQGGLSKLLSKCIEYAKNNNYNNIMTYVDKRIGDANGYVKSGFVIINKTPPRFWWTDNKNRFDRFKFKADKKNNLQQKEVAKNAGVAKIWSNGNIVLAYNV